MAVTGNPVTARTASGKPITSAAQLQAAMNADPSGVVFVDSNGKGEFTGDKLPTNSNLSVTTGSGSSVANVTQTGKNVKVS